MFSERLADFRQCTCRIKRVAEGWRRVFGTPGELFDQTQVGSGIAS
jgi:hypothetical protein